MLKARLECVINLSGDKCSYSSCDDCHLCCEQGGLEEQKEYLDIAIKSLEAWDKVKKETTNWHNAKLTIDQYEFLDIIEPYLSELEVSE